MDTGLVLAFAFEDEAVIEYVGLLFMLTLKNDCGWHDLGGTEGSIEVCESLPTPDSMTEEVSIGDEHDEFWASGPRQDEAQFTIHVVVVFGDMQTLYQVWMVDVQIVKHLLQNGGGRGGRWRQMMEATTTTTIRSKWQ